MLSMDPQGSLLAASNPLTARPGGILFQQTPRSVASETDAYNLLADAGGAERLLTELEQLLDKAKPPFKGKGESRPSLLGTS